MLSSKVVCAIDILNLLHQRYSEAGGGMKKSEIIAAGCMPPYVYGPVLTKLSRSRIVERKTTAVYIFSRQPSEVSLLDLIECLHQGVTLCEYIPTFDFRGTFNFKDSYQSVVRMEKALEVDLNRQLQDVKLSGMIGR